MALKTLAHAQALGNPFELRQFIRELQGLRSTLVTGAVAGTKMNIAAMRPEDTILSAIVLADAWAIPTDDAANITIQPVRATGTITLTGDPVADETVTVNGNVYTWKAAPSALNHVKITAGDNTAMALALANAINAYEGRYEPALNGDSNRTAKVQATAALGVVTVTALVDGPGSGATVTKVGAPITISSTDPGAVTATLVSVVADNTVTVNGVTFTAKAAPAAPNLDVHFAVKADDTAQATELARIINAYDLKYGTLDAIATSALGVVTIKARSGRTGNSITLSEASTNVAASGAFLTGGTVTGGIKSTTNLANKSLLITWFDKR